MNNDFPFRLSNPGHMSCHRQKKLTPFALYYLVWNFFFKWCEGVMIKLKYQSLQHQHHPQTEGMKLLVLHSVAFIDNLTGFMTVI